MCAVVGALAAAMLGSLSLLSRIGARLPCVHSLGSNRPRVEPNSLSLCLLACLQGYGNPKSLARSLCV